MIESHGITIIRTNPDDADFDMNRLINQTHMLITQSDEGKKRTRKQNKRTKKQNKRTRKQNKTTKEKVCKRIIKLCV